MNLNKEYFYNADKVVLLMCDYYETNQIPREMYSIKDNLALFPIANVPLIDLILTNLSDQGFTNVILAGSKIDSLLKYLKKTNFFNILNMRVFRSEGGSLGDVFRELDHLDFGFTDFLIMYANTYTNIPFDRLIRKHRKAKDNLLTFYTYYNDSNDTNAHLYASVDNKVIYYDKIVDGAVDAPEIFTALYKHKSVDVDLSCSSPTIAVVSNHAFHLFSENFDCHTLGDLTASILATGLYGYGFQLVRDGDIGTKKRSHSAVYSEIVPGSIFIADSAEESFYSREIITLLDYYKLNRDFADDPSIISHPFELNLVKGAINESHAISNSFVGECSFVNANISDCIVWDNCCVQEDYDGYIVFSNGAQVKVQHLESDGRSLSSPSPAEKGAGGQKETFFDSINNLLHARVATAKLYDNDMSDVCKQVSLLRIIWNASRQELIEAFAFFFVDMLDTNHLEDSLSKASLFFGVLASSISDRSDEELLMACIYDHLSELDRDLKVQILFNYGFLFVQEGIIDKYVVRKYNKMYKAGIL